MISPPLVADVMGLADWRAFFLLRQAWRWLGYL